MNDFRHYYNYIFVNINIFLVKPKLNYNNLSRKGCLHLKRVVDLIMQIPFYRILIVGQNEYLNFDIYYGLMPTSSSAIEPH
tara:strand:+ start:11802 stop:12044 length:243 start_codon:yes stop_codon:yes gene_type:complete